MITRSKNLGSTEASRMAIFVDGDNSGIDAYIIALMNELDKKQFSMHELSELMKFPYSDQLMERILNYLSQEGLVTRISFDIWRRE